MDWSAGYNVRAKSDSVSLNRMQMQVSWISTPKKTNAKQAKLVFWLMCVCVCQITLLLIRSSFYKISHFATAFNTPSFLQLLLSFPSRPSGGPCLAGAPPPLRLSILLCNIQYYASWRMRVGSTMQMSLRNQLKCGRNSMSASERGELTLTFFFIPV